MIEMDGPIPVATFMMQALHDRVLGFYATRESIGAGGSFVTAPEISQIFGELVGLWCAACWRDQGSPVQPLLVEFGPGRGTLTADMLRALRGAPDFLDELEVILVEASTKLETVQRERVADAPVPIRWVRRWDEIETDRPLFIIANEFFDALPIRQFVMTERGWCERMIVLEHDSLKFALSPRPVALPGRPVHGDAAPGAVYEISLAAASLVEDVARRVAANGGAALIIDYGYDAPGYGDTLQAVRGHAYDEVLAAPGEADLSAHVNFSALEDAIRRGGAHAHGPTTQAGFLRSLGIGTRSQQLSCANPTHAGEIEAAIARLTGADAMGNLFKVLAIAPGDAPAPAGFS